MVSFAACGGGGGGDDPEPDPPAPATPWLCFTAGSDAATVTTEIVAEVGTVTSPLPALEYSLDGGESWNTFTVADTSVTLPKNGDKMYIRAKSTNDVFSVVVDGSNFRIIIFVMTGSIAASGNIMSLLDKDCSSTTIPCNGCFYYLFYNCISLTAAPKLPAATLTEGCYAAMFGGCTNLTTAPVLPATTLYENCYVSMFNSCTSLTTAPELSATTLAKDCYASMFAGCTNLTTAPALSAATLVQGCYSSMFDGCTGLIAAPELPATTLARGCYSSMFRNCTSLTTAPDLLVSTLAPWCYNEMFAGCTGLIAAPELPATTLAENCYNQMFSGCSSLTSIKVHFADAGWGVTNATADWVKGVNSLGTFYHKAGLTDLTKNDDKVPTNFTPETF